MAPVGRRVRCLSGISARWGWTLFLLGRVVGLKLWGVSTLKLWGVSTSARQFFVPVLLYGSLVLAALRGLGFGYDGTFGRFKGRLRDYESCAPFSHITVIYSTLFQGNS